mmetsp:Transcript_24332/g.34810  ORF Transcript_24332/g.34810 Transcript_24332/m.34810 type:complete len:194 (-) Transcript_24332:316-897(-)
MTFDIFAETLKKSSILQTNSINFDDNFTENLKVFLFALGVSEIVVYMGCKALAWYSHNAFYSQELDWIHDIASGDETHQNNIKKPSRLTPVILEKSLYQRSHHGSIDSCPICLADFESGEEVAHGQNCSHLFHEVCVQTWLSKTRSCPCCRRSMEKSIPSDLSSDLATLTTRDQHRHIHVNNHSNDAIFAVVT